MTGYEVALILCIGEAAIVFDLYLAYRLIKKIIDNDNEKDSGTICCGEM